MKRWNMKTNKQVKNLKVDAFINEIIEISKKHGFSISHEDCHGSFEIKKIHEGNFEWLRQASDGTDQ